VIRVDLLVPVDAWVDEDGYCQDASMACPWLKRNHECMFFGYLKAENGRAVRSEKCHPANRLYHAAQELISE
jgi:hypothetical protein